MKIKTWEKWALLFDNGKNICVLAEKPKKTIDNKSWAVDNIYYLPCKDYKLKRVKVKLCK